MDMIASRNLSSYAYDEDSVQQIIDKCVLDYHKEFLNLKETLEKIYNGFWTDFKTRKNYKWNLLKISADKKVVVYGSRAKGNFQEGSDIDLTIIEEEIPSSVLLKLVNDFDDSLLPIKVDISIFSKLTNRDLIDHIKRVGQVFYQK